MSFAHDFPFDPTGGYTPEQLLNLQVELTEPDDFTCFWLETHELAMVRPLRWSMHPSTSHPGNADTEVFDIEFDSLLGEGNRVGGWLTKPRNRPAKRAVVLTHGYGGREDPDLAPPLPANADAAVIQPVLSGQPTRSFYPQLGIPGPDSALHQAAAPTCPHHVLYGIESRETYIHRFCAIDIWRAASVLHEAVPETRDTELDYIGGSFGGGMGAMALPWDKRFTRAHLGVPSFGNHPLRLQIPCTGSGEFVRLYAQKHPQIISEVLPYFDAALHARQIKIPVHVECAFFDPAVTPVGQFSVYHSLGGEKKLFAASSGHFEHSGTLAEQLRLRTSIQTFFEQAELGS